MSNDYYSQYDDYFSIMFSVIKYVFGCDFIQQQLFYLDFYFQIFVVFLRVVVKVMLFEFLYTRKKTVSPYITDVCLVVLK